VQIPNFKLKNCFHSTFLEKRLIKKSLKVTSHELPPQSLEYHQAQKLLPFNLFRKKVDQKIPQSDFP
jgi:hypothetical protein